MNDTTATIQTLRDLCVQFREARGWGGENPATFAKDIAVEVGELLDHFVWNEEASLHDKKLRQEMCFELVDMLYGVLIMSDILGLDVTETLEEKLKLLEKKYPAKLIKTKMKAGTQLARMHYYRAQRKKFKKA